MAINTAQKEAAGWLHPAIRELLQAHGFALAQLNAVAVMAGPGSYTGLRVGMATAKGLCYALKIPLVTVNTLQAMALAALPEPADLLCPMIDARRMEVFTAVYNRQLEVVAPPKAVILEPGTFAELLKENTIAFSGNGSTKFRTLLQHSHARFSTLTTDATHLAVLAHRQFVQGQLADLAYAEPFYGKEFYSPAHRH